MIKYCKHKDIDFKKWDDCISNSRNASFFPLSDVLNITSPNWDCLIYGDYEAVFPLPWRKKIGLFYVYPPFFSTQLGLFSKKEMDIIPFLQAIPSSFKYIEIKSNTDVVTPSENFVMKKNRTYYLSLQSRYEELFSRFSKNHKQNIHKSEKSNLSIQKEGVEVDDIIALFIENKGSISSFNKKDYAVLSDLMKHLINKRQAEVWSVFDENGKLCAGGFFVFYFEKVHFLFSGSNSISKERRAMFFLFAQFLKANAGSNLVFDFGGSNDDNLARFYGGFGSNEHFYDTICVNRLPIFYKWLANLKKKIG